MRENSQNRGIRITINLLPVMVEGEDSREDVVGVSHGLGGGLPHQTHNLLEIPNEEPIRRPSYPLLGKVFLHLPRPPPQQNGNFQHQQAGQQHCTCGIYPAAAQRPLHSSYRPNNLTRHSPSNHTVLQLVSLHSLGSGGVVDIEKEREGGGMQDVKREGKMGEKKGWNIQRVEERSFLQRGLHLRSTVPGGFHCFLFKLYFLYQYALY